MLPSPFRGFPWILSVWAGLSLTIAMALSPADAVADSGGQPLPCQPLPLAAELLPKTALQLPLPIPVTATSLMALDQGQAEATADDSAEPVERFEPEQGDSTLEQVFGDGPPAPSPGEGAVSDGVPVDDEDPVAVTANSADRAGAAETPRSPSPASRAKADLPSTASDDDESPQPTVAAEPRRPMPSYVRGAADSPPAMPAMV